MPLTITSLLGEEPHDLRRYLQNGDDEELARRRSIVAVSLVGIGCMAFTTLLQMGLVKDLPDPPRGNFHTKQVNSSETAYSFGGPDSPVTIIAHGVNIALAAFGGRDRADRHPWVSVLASAAAAGPALVAGKYLFYQMPRVDKAWCPYCITDALVHFATFALTVPETLRAIRPSAPRKLERRIRAVVRR
jgi:uncharacterized membrane protein